MFDQLTILRKIEQWVDKLPYLTVEIRIELPDETITLTKDKQRKIGFEIPQNK